MAQAQSATAPIGVGGSVIQPTKNGQGPGTVLSTTTVTTFHPKGNMLLKEALDQESDTGQSRTSYASSYADNSSYNLSVPNPPNTEDNDSDGEPFECPYCRDIVSIRNERSWK